MWRPDRKQWTQEHELLATLIEQTDFWGRRLAEMWGAKSHELPKPPQIDHPDRPRRGPERRPVTTDPAEIRQFFNARAGRG